MNSPISSSTCNRSVSSIQTQHGLNLLESISKLRKKRVLSDFKVKVGRKTIHVHKVVLAGSSVYYEAMFVHDTPLAQQGYEELQELDEEAAEACINFMYTGEIHVTHENAKGIFKVAHKLGIKELQDLSGNFLNDTLTVENCLVIKALAHKKKDKNLKSAADKFVGEHFDAVIATEAFTRLTKPELAQYLRSMKIATRATEMLKWNAIIKWCYVNLKERRAIFPDLFKYLKLECFDETYVHSVIAKEFLVDRYKKPREAVSAIFGEFIDGTIAEKKRREAQASADNNKTECIAVLDKKASKILALNLRDGQKIILKQISDIDNGLFSGIVSVQNKLYFHHDKNTFLLHRSKWVPSGALQGSPSHDAKHVAFKEFIYLIEGYKMSCCNVKLSVWKDTSPCRLQEVQCVASSDQYIYALGDGNKGKRYNPDMDTWEELLPMMNIRKGAAAVATEDKLYVLGGFKNKKGPDGYTTSPCPKVKCYDLKTNYWTTMPVFNSPRANFAACVTAEKVYIVGGIWPEFATGEPEEVEACNLDFQKWDKDVGHTEPVGGPVSACHFLLNN